MEVPWKNQYSLGVAAVPLVLSTPSAYPSPFRSTVVSPPGATTLICAPKFEYHALLFMRSVAPTAMTPAYAAGYIGVLEFELPAEATSVTPRLNASATAASSVALASPPPKLILITFAP